MRSFHFLKIRTKSLLYAGISTEPLFHTGCAVGIGLIDFDQKTERVPAASALLAGHKQGCFFGLN